MMTGSVDVTLTNASSKPVMKPIHAVISINNPTGVVTVPGALGGSGTAPYGKYYIDLTSRITAAQLGSGAKVTFNLQFVRKSGVTFSYKVTPYGVPEVPNLAPAVTISPVTPVTLPGTASLSATVTDDGRVNPTPALTWVKESGPGTVTFANSNSAITTASFSLNGDYVLRLNAYDGALTGTATVAVTVTKTTPTITWADPAAITYGTLLSATQLNATASVSGNFTYLPASGTELAVGPQALKVDFTPTDTTNYTTASATVNITVNAPPALNKVPVANAGANRTLTLPPGQSTLSVQLDGSASTDPDGTVAAYMWTGTPDPADVIAPTVSLTAGIYVFSLRVTDNLGLQSAASTVTVTVVQPIPPQVGLSPLMYTVNQGTTLTFAVTGMSPDGRGVTLSALPVIANATFAAISGTAASGTFSFTPSNNQSGIHLISFQARDPLGLTDTKTAQITINKVNHPPVISIAPTVTIDEGKSRVISANASDPDGDTLTLTATGLPNKNAVFVPSTGTIIFTPDFTQAGTYNVIVKADDGLLSSSATIVIIVNDVPNGGTVQPGEWTLNVNPVESPTFLSSLRIKGSVGTEGVTPVLQPAKPALITGMNPAIAEQGTTINVVLTGDSGDYLTHFASVLSKADFGSGITVNSLTITSPTQASANVTIAGNATTGSRSVNIATGNETAISVVGFNIVQGKTTLTGRLVDPDTKQPISGAIVTIAGTMFSTTTNSQGYFTLLNVPSGSQMLLINAVNHELVRSPFEAQTGATIDVGSVTPKATVFDPSAPASISLGSVVGRGIADTTGAMTEKEAKQLVTDAWLLVGGKDAGIIDAYGNQLNQEVTGPGQISLTPYGVGKLAEKIRRGDSMSLLDVLFAFSYGYKWSQGATPTLPDGVPPALTEWITRLQQMVNQAWADPTNPDSQFAILVFNKGQSLSPVPPTIGVYTRLSALQANLFVTSFLIHALDPQGNVEAASKGRPIMLAYNGEIPPGFLLADNTDPVDPGTQGRKSTMRHFWNNYFFSLSNFPGDALCATAGALLGAGITVMTTGGPVGMVIGTAMASAALGIVADIVMQAMVIANLATIVPSPPIPFDAEVKTGGDGKKTVTVTFDRSTNDRDHIGDTYQYDHNIFYYYTLYRYDVSPYDFSSEQRTEDVTRKAVANFCANCPNFPGSYENPTEIVDPDPTPDKIQYYDLTVSRIIMENKGLVASNDHLANTLPAWLNIIAEPAPFGAGMIQMAASPFYTLVEGLKQLTSDFSSMVVAYTGDIASSSANGIAVDPDRGYVYYSDIGKKAIYMNVWPNDNLTGTSLLANTAFKDPGQIGFAIDTWGRLYTDNHASDMDYGGRIFQFTPRQLDDTWDLPIWTADREFAGSVNYFSQVLMFANPASVSRMVYGGIVNKEALTVIDEICGCVKEVPVDSPADPSRKVGQVIAYFPTPDYRGPVLGLAFDKENNLYILTATELFQIPSKKVGTLTWPAVWPYVHIEGAKSPAIGGMAVDGYGNVYVSLHDADENGKVLMYPKDTCADDPDCEALVIMDGLDFPREMAISKDGRALFIGTKDGKLAKRYFGFSGLVRDVHGNPLAGASISLKTVPGGYGKSVKTDADGRFLVQNLFRSDLLGPNVDITIEYEGKCLTSVTRFEQQNGGQYGQTVREIIFAP
jgi:sugar lactone lactonase YvrE